MAHRIGPMEVAFASTFVRPQTFIIRITSENMMPSLNADDVEYSSGFFDLGSEAVDFSDRFIIWRAQGSKLELEERSVRYTLGESSSVCFCFVHDGVLPGTRCFFLNNVLTIVVPTQSAVHRFTVPIPPLPTLPSGRAVSLLELLRKRCENLGKCHDVFEVGVQKGVAVRVETSATATHISAVYMFSDGRISVLTIPAPSNVASELRYGVAKSESRRYPKRQVWNPNAVFSVSSCSLNANTSLFFVIGGDGKATIFTDSLEMWNRDVSQVFSRGTKHCEAKSVVLRVQKHNGRLFTAVYFQTDGDSFISVARPVPLSPFNANEAFSKLWNVVAPNNAVDFSFAVSNGILEFALLCYDKNFAHVIYTADVALEDDDPNAVLRWEESRIRPTEVALTETDTAAEGGTSSALSSVALSKRCLVFDPDNYPFDIVVRAAKLIPNAEALGSVLSNVAMNDWKALNEAFGKFFDSPQFNEKFASTSRESRLVGRNSLEQSSPVEGFMSTLKLNCDDLLQAACRPTTLWKSPNFGLHGSLEQGRFTVCVKGISEMSEITGAMCDSHFNHGEREAFFELIRLASSVSFSDISPTQNSHLVELLSVSATIVDEIVRLFVEAVPHESSLHFVHVTNAPCESEFTSGLMAAILRRHVADRRLFCSRFLNLIDVLRALLDSTMAFRDPSAWRNFMRKYESTLRTVHDHYLGLSRTLALRVLKGADVEVSLGEAFFSKGSIGILDIDENSKQTIQRSSLSAGRLSDTVSSSVSLALDALWPESDSLLIAKFLAAERYYDALFEYCMLNQPYPMKLESAFNYFEGVARAGRSQPEEATSCFLKAFEGVREGDEPLRRVICSEADSLGVFSCAEFFVKVMSVMESHDYSEQVAELGKEALREVQRDDPLLECLHTMMFKHELASARYADCLRTLSADAMHTKRAVYLRELISRLVDRRERGILIELEFGDMEDITVDILEGRARSAQPECQAFLFETLFAFHFKRFSIIRAASCMYEYASHVSQQLQSKEILVQRSHALSVVYQSLLLVPPRDRFLAVSIIPKDGNESNVADAHMDVEGEVDSHDEVGALNNGKLVDSIQKLRLFLDEHSHIRGTAQMTFLTANDIRKEVVLCDSRVALLEANEKEGVGLVPPPIQPSDVFDELIEKQLFGRAWILMRTYELSVYKLLGEMTSACIHLDASPPKNEPEWVIACRSLVVDSLSEDVPQLHWSVLQSYLKMAIEMHPSHSRVLYSVARVFLEYSWPLPHWLTTLYEEKDVGDYVKLLLTFDCLDLAFSTLKKAVDDQASRVVSSNVRLTIPVAAIDYCFDLYRKLGRSELDEQARQLTESLMKYFSRLESFSR